MKKKTWNIIIRHVVLALLAFIWLIPIVWLVVTSLSATKGVSYQHFFPTNWTLANFHQLFFETDYFPVDDTVDQPAYKAGFDGMTAGSFPADAGMITGATMTSGAVRQAITDSFAAFAQLQNGGK